MWGQGRGEMPTPHQHSRHMGELAPPLSSCSTQESGPYAPYAMPVQQIEADPEGVGLGDLTLKM